MLRTRIEENYRITIPEELRADMQIGDELFIQVTGSGQITLIPASRLDEILSQTAGLWKDRTDIPPQGIRYVNELRQGRRLHDLGTQTDDLD